MNIILKPNDKDKKIIKLVDKKSSGKMSFSCRFDVKYVEYNEDKIIQLVKDKGEKHVLDYNQKETKIMF